MNVTLVIRMKYGHFLAVPMKEELAREILGKFLQGTYKLQGPSRIGGNTPETGWAVDTNEIVACSIEPAAPAVGGVPGVSSGFQFQRG